MMNVSFDKRVLFLVVGLSCNLDKKQYLDLVGKTIKESCSDTIYLLASKTSKERAEQIENAFRNSHEIVIVDCCEAFDADKCYEEFEKIFSKVIKSGVSPDNIVIDFTHGTKPMSVALYAIGMRYKVSDFQYIERNIRKDEDVFNDGLEIVKTFDASYAKWLAIIDECKILFKNWQFGAIELLLSDKNKNSKIPSKLKKDIDCIKNLALFYNAWDSLDYKKAFNNMPYYAVVPQGFKAPTAKEIELIKVLSTAIKDKDNLTEDDLLQNKQIAINLMFDIYANGLRRLESGQWEDAGIRAYRMVELLGQIYLMDAGYMSDCLSMSDDKVYAYAENNKLLLSQDSLSLNRKQVVKFLDYIKYSKNDIECLNETKDFEKKYKMETIADKVKKRNKSILIHGYSVKIDSTNPKALEDLFNEILDKLQKIENFNSKKEAALFMNKFKDIK